MVINTANFVYFRALNDLRQLSNPRMIDIFTGNNDRDNINVYNINHINPMDVAFYFNSLEELLNLHRGQGMELYFRDSVICPTLDEYREIISNSK
jgi:geranylgeranyl diphosphate synthase type 3